MKKTFIAIAKLMLAIVAAIGILCIGMMQEWRKEVIIPAFLFGGIFVGYFLGFFDIEEEESNHLSIKHGARQMHRAA